VHAFHLAFVAVVLPETILNAKTVRDWLLKSLPGVDPATVVRQHMVAVRLALVEYGLTCCLNNCAHFSSATSRATAFGIDANNVFEFW
jgi:hypothetical protein